MSYYIKNETGQELWLEYIGNMLIEKISIPAEGGIPVNELELDERSYRIYYKSANRDQHSLEIYLELEIERPPEFEIRHRRSGREEGRVPSHQDLDRNTFYLRSAENVPIVIVGEIEIVGGDN